MDEDIFLERIPRLNLLINFFLARLLKYSSLSPRFFEPLPPIVNRNRRIDSFEDYEIPLLFRFRSKSQLHRLYVGFEFPENIVIAGYHFSGEEVLLAGLYRLHSVNVLGDAGWVATFGWSQAKCSFAFIAYTRHMANYLNLITDNLQFWQPYFIQYSECIRKKLRSLGSNHHLPVTNPNGGFNIAGFIDNKVICCARPGGGPNIVGHRNDPLIQRSFYNGWIHKHGIKFQTLDMPNGLNLHVWGPASVRHNDLKTLEYSDIDSKLRCTARRGTSIQSVRGFSVCTCG
jgi:hypothetical protein